jgi:hypothetical protein
MLERLEGADYTKEEELEGEPLAQSNTVKDHIRRDLSQHDTKRQHLLTNVKLILIDADIFYKVVSDGISHITTVKFCRQLVP